MVKSWREYRENCNSSAIPKFEQINLGQCILFLTESLRNVSSNVLKDDSPVRPKKKGNISATLIKLADWMELVVFRNS